MRLTVFCSLAVTAAILGSRCVPGAIASKAPLVLDVRRNEAIADDVPKMMRRQTSTDPVVLSNLGNVGYCATMEFGTPPVHITLGMTSLASDTWVNIPNSSFCEVESNGCATYGTYSPSDSSTYAFVSGGFVSYYGAGSAAVESLNGTFATDVAKIGDITLEDFQFAVANFSFSAAGFLGLGYVALEQDSTKYPNVPALLKQQGNIECLAYGLWLNPVNSSTGQLIFGGVDTDKYHGSLQTYSINPQDTDVYNSTLLNMADLQVAYNGQNTSLYGMTTPMVVAPDCGESWTYLPQAVFDNLVSALGATADPSSTDTAPTCNCSLLTNSTTLDFVFTSSSGTTYFDLAMSDIAFNYSGTCYLGILPTNDTASGVILGANFLRSVYIVYDFENNQISMAPTNRNSTSTNIKTIPAVGVAQNNAFQGVKPSGTASQSGSTPTRTAPPSTSTAVVCTSHCGLSSGAKVGIGVSVPLVVLLLCGLGFWFFHRRRRGYKAAATQESEKDKHGSFASPSELEPQSGKRQELGVEGLRVQEQDQLGKRVSELHGSDKYASALASPVGSPVASPTSGEELYELDSGGSASGSGLNTSSIKRKPVGSE